MWTDLPKHSRKKKKKDVLFTGSKQLLCHSLVHLFLPCYTALCYGPNVCLSLPPKFVCWNLPPCDSIWRRCLWEGIRYSEPFLMELASLAKRLQRTPLSLPSFEDIGRRRQLVIPEEGSPDTHYGGTWCRASSLQSCEKQRRVVWATQPVRFFC